MTTDRRQVSLWLQTDEYDRLKRWADNGRRKVATAAKVIILDRLDHDERQAVTCQADEAEGSAQG